MSARPNRSDARATMARVPQDESNGAAAGIRRTVLTIVLVALAVRLLCLFTVPLVIANDGQGYITWAKAIMHGDPVAWPIYRTPGYSLFLAGIFSLFGVGP